MFHRTIIPGKHYLSKCPHSAHQTSLVLSFFFFFFSKCLPDCFLRGVQKKLRPRPRPMRRAVFLPGPKRSHLSRHSLLSPPGEPKLRKGRPPYLHVGLSGSSAESSSWHRLWVIRQCSVDGGTLPMLRGLKLDLPAVFWFCRHVHVCSILEDAGC